MARQMRRIYLCEGETEQHLVKALVQARLIQPGKVERFNAAQMDAKKQVRKWGREVQLIVIVDGDTGPYDDSSQLARNFMVLKRLMGVPELIVQCMNLEDELAACCGITRQWLYAAFDSASTSEFKGKFMAVRQNQLMARLESMGFDPSRLWQQPCRGSALKGALAGWKSPDVWA